VRKALANIVEPAETPKVNDKAEIQIDWAKVKSPGWLKSAADLPADAPRKLKVILGHTGILAELTQDLMAADLLNKPYRSWSEVTFALAAAFKQWGKYSVEEIAETLMADLPCNRHITKNPDPHRAVERAINRSHDRVLGLPGHPAINFRDFTEKGKARASLANAVIAIKALGIEIRRDLFHHRIIVKHNGAVSTVQEGILTDDTIDAIRSLINNINRIDCKEYMLAAVKGNRTGACVRSSARLFGRMPGQMGRQEADRHIGDRLSGLRRHAAQSRDRMVDADCVSTSRPLPRLQI
jgi:hypothetical protein